MIHVVVGTSHLSAVLGYRRGHQFNAVLRRTLEPLVGMPIRTLNTAADLAGVTVFEVLEDFHNRASALLRAEPAEVMTAQRDEIMRVAQQEYHYPAFETTIEDACCSVAIHGLFPHGTLTSRGTKAFLPEFSIGVRCFGFFARSPSSTGTTLHSQKFQEIADFIRGLDGPSMDETTVGETITHLASLRDHLAPPFAPYELLDEIEAIVADLPRERQEMFDRLRRVPAMLDETVRRVEAHARREVDGAVEHLWANRHAHDLQKLECHLCDTLQDVYGRAESYWDGLRAAARKRKADGMFFEMQFERTAGEDYLVLDAVAHGFQGHRSLRRDNPEVPALGNHRLLAGKATRQGVGKPVVSGLFPISLWRLMESPVQHFILNAAEKVGAERCPPLYPNMPLEEDMRQLYWAAARAEGDCGFEVEDYSDSLRKLGVEGAVRRRIAAYLERSEGGEWAWDWTRAIFEYQSALYDDDIEQSLHLQDLLDLYPLHKRVLGLVEYILVPQLVSRGVGGNAASALWTNAFTGWRDAAGVVHSGLSSASLPTRADLLATLETEGNWLLYAADHEASGRTGPIGLAALLDGIVARMSSATEVAGVSINLQPPTPQEHARQLSALADRSNRNAACMTLYLGKVALMLRNAVEHGTDRVVRDGLLLETPGYWTEERGPRNNRLPVFDWLRDAALRQASWRSSTSLPTTLPGAANALLLTPGSLHRCVVLLTLVMHGGFSQLGI